MRFTPIGKYKKAKQRGSKDFLAGKKVEDNPYLRLPDVALSSWWQTGFLQEKNRDA